MPDTVDLAHAIRLTPRQAVRYFKSKGYDFDWNWWETLEEAHAKSFVVAKATRLDVLSSLRRQLDRAIEKGISEAEFLRNMEPNLKRLGWGGKQVIVDPSGGAEVVQLGSPHRLKTIFRTNMNTAFAHGTYRRQMAAAHLRPYWMYVAVMDTLTRPEHAALNDKVFRYDDPIWRTLYPPNGFNCRCRVVALTGAEVKARGLVIESSKRRLSDVTLEAGVDKRTGEVVTYRVEDKKLERSKHPEISVARLRTLQKALDRGLVAIEKPGRRRQHGRNTLLAMYYEDGTWWRHSIRIAEQGLPLITLFDDPVGKGTEKVLNRKELVVLQEWDNAHWSK